MVFARPRLLMGLQPYMRATMGTPYIRAAIQARRLLSTSTCSHAQHAPANQNPGEPLHHHNNTTAPIYDARGKEVDPYKDGPGALDKAVHLFFFTEIIRGMVPVFSFLSRC
jgi:NADH dehydrogenase (ubiquinone) Fe-S protein 8